jgi:membrane-associated HD superfamily phosphohydrolase
MLTIVGKMNIQKRKLQHLRLFFSCFAAFVFAGFQNALPFALAAILIVVFLMLALRYENKKKVKVSRKESLVLLLFSLFLSIAVVYSHNIVISVNTYSGLATENYLIPWNLFDWLGLVVSWVVVYLLFSAAYSKMKERTILKRGG